MADEPQMSRKRAQALAALEKANASRTRKKELREQLRDGKLDGLDLLRGEYPVWDQVIREWPIERVLSLIPGVGPATVQEVLEVGRFSPTQLIVSLNRRRREELARLCGQGRRAVGHG